MCLKQLQGHIIVLPLCPSAWISIKICSCKCSQSVLKESVVSEFQLNYSMTNFIPVLDVLLTLWSCVQNISASRVKF